MNFNTAAVGSGLAGLTTILHPVGHRRVVVISKRSLPEGASDWAQGNTAVVLDSGDSHDEHVDDTFIVGAGLCNEAATCYIIENRRSATEWLIGRGVPFTRDGQAELGFHLAHEGGHRHRRIIRATGITSHVMVTTLVEKICNRPNITLPEDHFAIDPITNAKLGCPDMCCHGLYALDIVSGHVKTITANQIVIATGGMDKVYLYTTNSGTASGDGIATIWRVGCRVANMGFVQLHPTYLHRPLVKSFLITEAARDEGGKLILPDDTCFMPAYDKRTGLASRDTIVRVIDFETKKRSLSCVYLDISHQSPAFLKEYFPTTMTRCLELGTDITRQPIPVMPAVRYAYDGMITDHLGRMDIAGLYAVGGAAYTGLYDTNRPASNSLLKRVAIGRDTVGNTLAQPPPDSALAQVPAWDKNHVIDPDEEVIVSHNWDELHHMMWNYINIMHTNKWLERTQHRIASLRRGITEYYANLHMSHDLLKLRNLVEAASPIVSSTLSRRESHGPHSLHDYPEALPKTLPTIMQPTHRQIIWKR